MSDTKLWQAFIEGAVRGMDMMMQLRNRRAYWAGKIDPKAGEQRLVVDQGIKREDKQ